jgi:hypothetical protein
VHLYSIISVFSAVFSAPIVISVVMGPRQHKNPNQITNLVSTVRRFISSHLYSTCIGHGVRNIKVTAEHGTRSCRQNTRIPASRWTWEAVAGQGRVLGVKNTDCTLQGRTVVLECPKSGIAGCVLVKRCPPTITILLLSLYYPDELVSS